MVPASTFDFLISKAVYKYSLRTTIEYCIPLDAILSAMYDLTHTCGIFWWITSEKKHLWLLYYGQSYSFAIMEFYFQNVIDSAKIMVLSTAAKDAHIPVLSWDEQNWIALCGVCKIFDISETRGFYHSSNLGTSAYIFKATVNFKLLCYSQYIECKQVFLQISRLDHLSVCLFGGWIVENELIWFGCRLGGE